MSEDRARNVGSPTGESTYREVMFREEFADGTMVDSEPENISGRSVQWGTGLPNFGDHPKPVRIVRYERSVTVYASEWVPTPENRTGPAVGDQAPEVTSLTDQTDLRGAHAGADLQAGQKVEIRATGQRLIWPESESGVSAGTVESDLHKGDYVVNVRGGVVGSPVWRKQ